MTEEPKAKQATGAAEIAALKQQIEALTALVNSATKPKPALGVISNEEASAAVKAARSKTPKTYRALQNGTDLTQGFIPEGTVFTTTQPQGSWMEPVDAAAD